MGLAAICGVTRRAIWKDSLVLMFPRSEFRTSTGADWVGKALTSHRKRLIMRPFFNSLNRFLQHGCSQEQEVTMKSTKAAALLLVLALTSDARSQDFIAYVVPAGTPGNQRFTGALGMD